MDFLVFYNFGKSVIFVKSWEVNGERIGVRINLRMRIKEDLDL